MEISYKKDGTSNVMIVKNQKIEKDDYKFQMVINNAIDGIVPMSIKTVNNIDELHYQVTSMISLENMYAGKKMSGEELCSLVRNIEILLERTREYLLDFNDIMFDPEFIYIKKQTGKYEFCYIPQKRKGFYEELKKLFDSILEYIDYKDKNAVIMAYELQQMVASNDFTIADLVRCAKDNMEKFISVNDTNESKNKEIQYRESENIAECEPDKKGLLKNISDLLRGRSRYKDEEELESTIMLTDKKTMSITLKSTDMERGIKIDPVKFPCVIGKSRKGCDFFINSSVISRRHIRVTESMEGYFIEDLNSTNGTFINGMRLEPQCPVRINIGDKITLADMDFIVE